MAIKTTYSGAQIGLHWAIALLIAVLTVALSRLYLQVHYPSDVLFAAGAAVLWVLALRNAGRNYPNSLCE